MRWPLVRASSCLSETRRDTSLGQSFGDATDQPEAFEIMGRAADLGVNFFDTADVYSGPLRAD